MARMDRTTMFLTGMGIGVAGAILLAPYSGEETRKRLKRSASEAAGAVQDRTNALKKTVSKKASETMERARATFQRGNEAVDSAKSKARDLTHEAGIHVEHAGAQVQRAGQRMQNV